MFTNTAHIQNRGVELIVCAYPIPKTSKFSWQTVFNFFKNKNRIMSLDREDYVKDNIWYVAAGHAAGNFYGYQYQGIYQYDASNAYTEDYSTRLIPVVQRDGD